MRCVKCGKVVNYWRRSGLCNGCGPFSPERRQRIRESLVRYYAEHTYASVGHGEPMGPVERERLLRNVARLNPGLLPRLMEAMERWEQYRPPRLRVAFGTAAS